MQNTMHLRDEFESFPRRNNAPSKGLVTNSNNIMAQALTEGALRAAGYNGGSGDVAMTANDVLRRMTIMSNISLQIFSSDTGNSNCHLRS